MLIVCFHVLELLLDDAAMPRGIQVPGQGTGDIEGPCPTLARGPLPPNTPLLPRQDASLGQVSFSIFGSFGAALQVVLILYPSGGHSCPLRCPPCPPRCPPRCPPGLSHTILLDTPRSYLMVSSVVGFYSSPLFTRLLPERRDTPLTKVGAWGWGWGGPDPPPPPPPGYRTSGPHSARLWVSLCGVPMSPSASIGRVLGELQHWEPFPTLRGGPGAAVPPPLNTPSSPPDHRELRLLAGAQLGPARLLQDAG